ncbi:hypothetical protein DIPPA_01826, partial [Diplonema papillatum]
RGRQGRGSGATSPSPMEDDVNGESFSQALSASHRSLVATPLVRTSSRGSQHFSDTAGRCSTPTLGRLRASPLAGSRYNDTADFSTTTNHLHKLAERDAEAWRRQLKECTEEKGRLEARLSNAEKEIAELTASSERWKGAAVDLHTQQQREQAEASEYKEHVQKVEQKYLRTREKRQELLKKYRALKAQTAGNHHQHAADEEGLLRECNKKLAKAAARLQLLNADGSQAAAAEGANDALRSSDAACAGNSAAAIHASNMQLVDLLANSVKRSSRPKTRRSFSGFDVEPRGSGSGTSAEYLKRLAIQLMLWENRRKLKWALNTWLSYLLVRQRTRRREGMSRWLQRGVARSICHTAFRRLAALRLLRQQGKGFNEELHSLEEKSKSMISQLSATLPTDEDLAAFEQLEARNTALHAALDRAEAANTSAKESLLTTKRELEGTKRRLCQTTETAEAAERALQLLLKEKQDIEERERSLSAKLAVAEDFNKDTMNRLREESSRALSQKSSLESECTRMKEDKIELKHQLEKAQDSAKRELDGLRQRAEALAEDLEAAARRLADEKDTVQRLEAARADEARLLQKATAETAALSLAVEAGEEQRLRLEEAEEQLAGLEEELARKCAAFDAVADEQAVAEAALVTLREERDTSDRDLEGYKEEATLLQSQASQLRQAHEAAFQAWEAAKAQLHRELAAKGGEMDDLKQTHEAAFQAWEAAKAQLQDELAAKGGEMDGIRQELATSETRCTALAAAVAALEDDLAQARAASQSGATLESALKESRRLHAAAVAALEDDLAQAQAALQTQEAALEESRRLHAAAVAALEDDLAQAQAASQTQEAALEESRRLHAAAVAALEDDLAQAQAALQTQEAALE